MGRRGPLHVRRPKCHIDSSRLGKQGAGSAPPEPNYRVARSRPLVGRRRRRASAQDGRSLMVPDTPAPATPGIPPLDGGARTQRAHLRALASKFIRGGHGWRWAPLAGQWAR
ncbi:hypothetical protein MRX96_044331 [Rhipicephalus microplus]